MTSAISSAATTIVPATITSAQSSSSTCVKKGSYDYKASAVVGGFMTGIATLINPIAGAGLGSYFITEIAVNAAGDWLGLDDAGLIGKVAKAVTSFFIGMGVAMGVLVTFGVAVTFTPELVACLAGCAAVKALFTIGNNCP